MSAVAFDTLKFVERLKAGGMDEKTAKAEVFSEALGTQRATKRDLVELKLDMIKWMVGLSLAQIALSVGMLTKIWLMRRARKASRKFSGG